MYKLNGCLQALAVHNLSADGTGYVPRAATVAAVISPGLDAAGGTDVSAAASAQAAAHAVADQLPFLGSDPVQQLLLRGPPLGNDDAATPNYAALQQPPAAELAAEAGAEGADSKYEALWQWAAAVIGKVGCCHTLLASCMFAISIV